MNEFEKWDNEILTKVGFNPEELTQNQKDVILEPVNAPENYMCDGEITSAQALVRYKRRLAESGLTQSQVRQAVKNIIG